MASSRQPLCLLAAIVAGYLAANFAWLAWAGIHTGGDTLLITRGAARVLEGRLPEGHQAVHVAYLQTVALWQSIGAGPIGVVGMQIVIAAAALVAIYRLGFALAGPIAGLVAASLFACDVETARWHVFVLTDSLYLSVLPIAVWGIHGMATRRGRDWRRVVGGLLPLSTLALIRPEGWPIPLIAAVYWPADKTAHRLR